MFYSKKGVNPAEKRHNRNRCLKIEARLIQTGSENSFFGMSVVSHKLQGEVASPSVFHTAFGGWGIVQSFCGGMTSFCKPYVKSGDWILGAGKGNDKLLSSRLVRTTYSKIENAKPRKCLCFA